ncbi:hypothetical protein PACTADRAFT_49933 [Pachysolen tannophilus NRRL Y-2460]|uniref:Folic acid synthesis protein fol1 n=1 Tax=Pachysolen tannophilus NRRL Y-2460 TaxID=669874 RepID=A0A1E4TTW0_PACTA|nr:hypothetical protein PACTADRAFT_49933 [Pachysolen tannophilus NRRL Y-2460]
MGTDLVSIKNLKISAITGKDFWSRSVLQPLEVSVDLKTSFTKASLNDDLKYSLNYAVISNNILNFFDNCKSTNFQSLEKISNFIFKIILQDKNGSFGRIGKVCIKSTKSEIRCDNIEIEMERTRDENDKIIILPQRNYLDKIKINGLKLFTIIGVFKFERLQKQIVNLDIEIQYDFSQNYEQKLDYYLIIDKIVEYVEHSKFKTVEALVLNVANLIFQSNQDITICKVAVIKPNAILFSDGVGVSIEKTRKDLKDFKMIEFQETDKIEELNKISLPNFNDENSIQNDFKDHIVYIAFGSNEGNQYENILKSFQELIKNDIKIISTSTLYESKPMYYLKQPNFYNGVIKTSTRHSPHELLKILKKIEYEKLDRIKKFNNGPRTIDLDILLYDNLILNDTDLTIPHISLCERNFVLAPLCELLSPNAIHPITAEPFHNHLKQLFDNTIKIDSKLQESNDLINVIPLPTRKKNFQKLSFDLIKNTSETIIMGILNVTPDSFSDAGSNYHLDQALKTVESMCLNGVKIIDIGGCSTRPGSEQPTEEEELSRVLPIVKAIRSHENPQINEALLSIDTYRSKVAEESIKLGADIINDISAGLFDNKMFDVVAKYGVPYIVNHTRGTIATMNKLTNYNQEIESNDEFLEFNLNFKDNKENPLLSIISKELTRQLSIAYSKGVKKWQIILDPGIGFAKTTEQNIITIKSTRDLKKKSLLNKETGEYISFNNLPVLIGPSRKKFIGNLTRNSKVDERLIGTCAAVMSCIGFGADIVRVHDYKEVRDVCLIGDAIYKNR